MKKIEELKNQLLQETAKLDATDGYHMLLITFDEFKREVEIHLRGNTDAITDAILLSMISNKESSEFWDNLLEKMDDKLTSHVF